MKSAEFRVQKWLRRRAQSIPLTILNKASDLQHAVDRRWPAAGDHTIHLYWFVEGLCFCAWERAYAGSDEEMRDALELNFGEDLDHYSKRQQEIICRRAEWEAA